MIRVLLIVLAALAFIPTYTANAQDRGPTEFRPTKGALQQAIEANPSDRASIIASELPKRVYVKENRSFIVEKAKGEDNVITQLVEVYDDDNNLIFRDNIKIVNPAIHTPKGNFFEEDVVGSIDLTIEQAVDKVLKKGPHVKVVPGTIYAIYAGDTTSQYGRMDCGGTTWTNARDCVNPQHFNGVNSLGIGWSQTIAGDNWDTVTLFIYFDLSSVPTSGYISDADFSLVTSGSVNPTPTYEARIFDYLSGGFTVADVNDVNPASNWTGRDLVGSIVGNTIDTGNGDRNSFTSSPNEAGPPAEYTIFNLGGTTGIAITADRIYNATAPTDPNQQWGVYAPAETGTTNDPLLVLTHEGPFVANPDGDASIITSKWFRHVFEDDDALLISGFDIPYATLPPIAPAEAFSASITTTASETYDTEEIQQFNTGLLVIYRDGDETTCCGVQGSEQITWDAQDTYIANLIGNDAIVLDTPNAITDSEYINMYSDSTSQAETLVEIKTEIYRRLVAVEQTSGNATIVGSALNYDVTQYGAGILLASWPEAETYLPDIFPQSESNTENSLPFPTPGPFMDDVESELNNSVFVLPFINSGVTMNLTGLQTKTLIAFATLIIVVGWMFGLTQSWELSLGSGILVGLILGGAIGFVHLTVVYAIVSILILAMAYLTFLKRAS